MPAPKDPEKYEEWRRKLRGKPGPNKGRIFSEETRAKMAAAKRGKPGPWQGKHRSDETKAKISEKLMGHELAPEQRKRHLEAIQRHNESITVEQREKMGWSRGVPHAEEHNRRISEGNKGRAYTEVQRQALHTPEVEAKRRLGLKKAWEALPPEEKERRSKKFVEAGRKGSKNHDTNIECFVARQLDALQIIYEKQKRIGLYAADFFIPADNLIIEVNGCFWHGCEQCGFNDEMHYEKRAHDTKRLACLESKGYTVGIIWEHDLRPFMDS